MLSKVILLLLFLSFASGAFAQNCKVDPETRDDGSLLLFTTQVAMTQEQVLASANFFYPTWEDLTVIILAKSNNWEHGQVVPACTNVWYKKASDASSEKYGIYSTCEPDPQLMGCTKAPDDISLQELSELSGKEIEFYIERNGWKIEGPLEEVVIPKGTNFWVL